MRYFAALVSVSLVLFAGCLPGPTGNPPSHPQPSFEYDYTQRGDATVLSIEAVDPGGLSDHPIRIRIGEHVAYENGSFRGPYAVSDDVENEWADGVETGDVIRITNGTALAPGREVSVALSPADESGYVTVSTNETPTSVPGS